MDTVHRRHIGRDILVGLLNIVGGEVHEYAKLGASAVIATRFTTSVLMGGAAELLAIGTAVVVEDE